ncbi:hypothetical protein IPF86_03870 [Candidatus Nomurabacteria bacterium]|jgi:hypothetical protein|nr:MAG: hypothetical protein IPF86_03870 [Candidatus Nomurabacteria bacterium]
MALQLKKPIHPDLWLVSTYVAQIEQWSKTNNLLHDEVKSNKKILIKAVQISNGYCCNRLPKKKEVKEVLKELLKLMLFCTIHFKLNGKTIADATVERLIIIFKAIAETNTLFSGPKGFSLFMFLLYIILGNLLLKIRSPGNPGLV